MKLIFVTIIFLVLHENVVKSQFLVEVVQFIQPNLNKVDVRCTGTLLTNQFVITTASCAKVSPPYELAIKRKNRKLKKFHTIDVEQRRMELLVYYQNIY